MAKQRLVGTGSVEERIAHLFTYKGMEGVHREQVDALLRCVGDFLVADGPRARAVKMAAVLGVESLSHTRIPLHLSQAKLMHYTNRYGWCLTDDAQAFVAGLDVR
jgi:Mn-dependent DtxR family transcriptional regulator